MFLCNAKILLILFEYFVLIHNLCLQLECVQCSLILLPRKFHKIPFLPSIKTSLRIESRSICSQKLPWNYDCTDFAFHRALLNYNRVTSGYGRSSELSRSVLKWNIDVKNLWNPLWLIRQPNGRDESAMLSNIVVEKPEYF